MWEETGEPGENPYMHREKDSTGNVPGELKFKPETFLLSSKSDLYVFLYLGGGGVANLRSLDSK